MDGGNTDQMETARDALSSLSVLGDENQDGSNDGNNDGNKDGNDEGNQTNSSNDNPPPPPQAQPFSFDFRQPAAAAVAADDVEFADQNEFLALLPPSLLPKLEKLKSLHLAREELMEEYRSERAKLEARFHARMKPLYEERRKVVVGEMDEEFRREKEKEKEKQKNEDKENDEKEKDEKEKEKEMAVDEAEKETKDEEEFVKGIPQFWACAMGHFDVISELVTEEDVDCLKFMTDVTCENFPDGTGFELKFHFSPENPYFTNTVLTKRYEVPNLLTEDEPILKNVTGTTIHWKPNKSLTHKEITKKQRKKGGHGAGQIRTVTKRERTKSFFHFFTPPKMPNMEDVMDEEEADAVEEAFDFDYDVAQAFRGHLIPKGVLWFTGEAAEGDLGDLEEDEEEEGEEGEDRAGEEGGGSPFPPPVPGNGDTQECKQN
ncbi:hypothetical protein ACHAXS_000751 [Conticribra weissflogii]